MTLTTLAPIIFAISLLLVIGFLVYWDPFRAVVHIAQILFSVFVSGIISWSLWLIGDVVVYSFYPTTALAWDINILVAMTVGPPVTRWIHRTFLSGAVHSQRNEVLLALFGAIAGALLGRLVLSEEFASQYSSTGVTGSPRVAWTWLGATIGGHLYGLYLALNGILRRLEP